MGGQHFARVDGDVVAGVSATYFYHTDHLGSTVLVTNASAGIVWSSEYTPFGSLALEEGKYGFQKAKKFTGKDLDEDTGLYYYNARWYDAEVGRFTSADTYKGELENPQTLNLYVYTLNNPIKYTDPTGHWVDAEGMAEYFSEKENDPTILERFYERDKKIRTIFNGGLRMIGGAGQIATGLPLAAAPEPASTAGGIGIMAWGGDNVIAGLRTIRQGFKGGESMPAFAEKGLIYTGGEIGEKINGEKGRNIGENFGQMVYTGIDLGISIYGTVKSVESISGHIQEKNNMMNMINRDSSPQINFVLEGSEIKVQPFKSAYSPGNILTTNQLAGNLVMTGNDIVSYPGSIDSLLDSLGLALGGVNLEPDLDKEKVKKDKSQLKGSE